MEVVEAELLKEPDCEENQQTERRTRFGSTLTRLYLMGGRCAEEGELSRSVWATVLELNATDA